MSPRLPSPTLPSPPDPGPALPGLSTLLGAALPVLLADCRRHVKQITGIERAVGGNVSHVFRVHGAHGSVILKVRGDRFARIPALRTDPSLIADERRALAVYAEAAPSVFPRVLAFHAQTHAMILTDIFPDHRNYHQHLDERPATAAEMTRLGNALRRIHQATRDVTTEIRSQGDVWFRDHTFSFCLRATGHDVLSQACEELAELPGQQLILGDLAPKNLSLAADNVAICDLDNVHRGWPLYDLAYFLAHLLLHHLRWAEHLRTLVPALLAAYPGAEPPQRQAPADGPLMAKVVAGVVLYRLFNDTVPYPLAGPPVLASRFRDRVLRLLDTGTFTVQDLQHTASAPARADA